jgi:ubiquinone/menaquinone biosynthesis C-methylase UbiE
VSRSDYDQWAEAYATANAEGFFNAWYEKPAMLRLLGDVAGRRVLDAGCGSGSTSLALVERGADVSGFDVSTAMIEIARRNLPATDLRVHDLAEPLPWDDDTFDIAVASLVLHYLEDWSKPLAELHRVLSWGAQLLVSVNHPGAFPIVHPDLEYFGTTEYTED